MYARLWDDLQAHVVPYGTPHWFAREKGLTRSSCHQGGFLNEKSPFSSYSGNPAQESVGKTGRQALIKERNLKLGDWALLRRCAATASPGKIERGEETYIQIPFLSSRQQRVREYHIYAQDEDDAVIPVAILFYLIFAFLVPCPPNAYSDD